MTTSVELTQYYVDKLKAELTGADVFYGDQDAFKGAITVCLEPISKDTEFANASMNRTLAHTFTISAMIYANYVSSGKNNRLEADIAAENLSRIIDLDFTSGGLVNRTLVTRIEAGYFTRASGTSYAVSKVTITANLEERII